MDVKQVVYAYDRGCQNFIGDLASGRASYWINNEKALAAWCNRLVTNYDYLFYDDNINRIDYVFELTKTNYFKSSVCQCVKYYDHLVYFNNGSLTGLREYLINELTALAEVSLAINSEFTEIMRRYMEL